MAKKRKRPTKAELSVTKDELVNTLHTTMNSLRSLIDKIHSETDITFELDETREKLDAVVLNILGDDMRNDLHVLQGEIANKLRKTADVDRPNMDDRIGFFFWVIRSVVDAERRLRYLDATGTCPDNFRTHIKAYFEDAEHAYDGL